MRSDIKNTINNIKLKKDQLQLPTIEENINTENNLEQKNDDVRIKFDKDDGKVVDFKSKKKTGKQNKIIKCSQKLSTKSQR